MWDLSPLSWPTRKPFYICFNFKFIIIYLNQLSLSTRSKRYRYRRYPLHSPFDFNISIIVPSRNNECIDRSGSEEGSKGGRLPFRVVARRKTILIRRALIDRCINGDPLFYINALAARALWPSLLVHDRRLAPPFAACSRSPPLPALLPRRRNVG